MKSYKDLDIYNLAFEYAVEVHKLSLLLPNYENYELGSQVRRSSKSIAANIVEGYGRRKYKNDFIKFLINAHASLLETISHLEMCNKLYKVETLNELIQKYNQLGAKIFTFTQYVEREWKS